MDCTHSNVKCRNCDAVLKTECLPFYRVQEMEAEVSKLRGLLKHLEWCSEPEVYHRSGMCPQCGGVPARGHAHDCELAEALK